MILISLFLLLVHLANMCRGLRINRAATVLTLMHCFFLMRYWMVAALQPVLVGLSGCLAAWLWRFVTPVQQRDIIQVEHSLQQCINRSWRPTLWTLWHLYNPNIIPDCQVASFVLH